MKNINNIRYFLYVLFTGLILFFAPTILSHYLAKSYFNAFIYNMLTFLCYGSIGFILGLEKLKDEIGKEGNWRVNLHQVLIIGLPSLYFSLGIIISTAMKNFISYPIYIYFNNGPFFMYIFQIVFTYTVTTSFYKQIKL